MKDRYLKKLIWRKSMSLKNPIKRNWSCKNMAWESFFFSPLLPFWKCEITPWIWKLTVCHVVLKLPVLPKARVIPCWEKPGERENVISDCLWATVWENEQCSSSRWARLAGSELWKSHRAGRACGGTGTDGLSTAGPHDAVCDASCSALHTSRCCGQAGSQAGLHT